jgi:spermidine export protein MdtJ
MQIQQPASWGHDQGATGCQLNQESSHFGWAWFFLAMAIATEVCGLIVMKLSTSIGRIEGLAVLYVMVALSYVFLAKAVRSIPIGVAYAIWEGSGIALITVVSAILFQQHLTTKELLGLSMAIVGIWMIHAGESQHE